MRLSIVIVTYNSRREIDACLAALERHPSSVPSEIVIVDNQSLDGTATAVRERWPAVRVIDSGGNSGFARGCNIGFRHTSGDLVLLLNPDTQVGPGALDRLVGILDEQPDVAVVGPRLVDERGRPELSFGSMIGPWAEFRQKLLVRGHDRAWPLVSDHVRHITAADRPVDWVSGACLLVRRLDAEAVGLLDERYFMYAEDVDFCAAIRARGRRVLFVAAAEVLHARGRSAASARSATEAAYRASQLAFYGKHRPAWLPILKAYLKLRGRLPDTGNIPRDQS